MSSQVCKHKYSPEQDAAILKAKRGDCPRLAACFGVSRGAIFARRKYLRQQSLNAEPSPSRRKVVVSRLPLPFARPAWFDENLEVLSRGTKPFVSRLTQ